MSNLNKFTIAVPFAVLPASGISYPLNLYNFPLLLKNKIVSCVDAVNICFTKSSSLVEIPVIPLPPLFWLLYVSIGILLIYPKCVRATTVCSSLIKSSTFISPSAATIFVFLSSPYFCLISSSSSLIISNTNCSLANISLKWAINFINSLYSSSIFSRCKPDNVFNLISRIACAWISERPNLFINLSFASSYEDLIILITSSMLSNAIFKPSNMCALASALSSSNLVLRVITCSLWAI